MAASTEASVGASASPLAVRPAGFLRRNAPAFLLVALSITFAEFLTGSTVVVAAFLDPIALAFLLGLYGAGVLLVREAAVRWKKGWPTILLLGAAYGIAEEGIGTKTFFGPKGVGSLAVYGHFAGVNWVWAAELTIFHAVYSIALPIAIVGLTFPETADRSFIASPRLRGGTFAIFVATVVAMLVLFNRGEIPGPALLLAALAAIGLLIVLARRAPIGIWWFGPPVDREPSSRTAFAVGLAFVAGFFGIVWIGSAIVPVPGVVIGALVVFVVAIGTWLARRSKRFAEPEPRLAFAVGALSLLIGDALLLGAFGDYGVFVVVAALGVGGLWLRRRIAARRPTDVPAGVFGSVS